MAKNGKSEKEQVAYKIINLEQANKHHDSYGFSMLQVETNYNTFNIGRITDRYFRIQQEVINDKDLMVALGEIDEQRDLLLVSNNSFRRRI